MNHTTESAVRRRWVTGSSMESVSLWFVLVFGLGAVSPPATGIPLMFAALVIFRRAHPYLRKIGFAVAAALTVYAVLFLMDLVQFIYWQ